MTSKRRASTGLTSPDSDSLSPSSGPPHKAHRPSTSPPPTNPSSQSDSQSSPLIHQCTLPPTCQPPINKPTALSDASALERHYATYHTHVCEEGPCRAVFPEARFLELHQTECHDPLAAVRKERGDKIFACFLSTCPKHFSTPKTRRMHLLQAHSYPKQYFYNITNYGVGGLLRKYGEGASLIRPDWKPRDDKQAGDDSMGVDGDSEDGKDEDLKPTPLPPLSKAKPTRDPPPHLQPAAKQGDTGTDDVDALANNLESMQLIPPSVHFGRGASHGGFKAPSGRGRGRGARAGRGHRARTSQDGTGVAEDDDGEDEKAKERERKEMADKEREKEVIAFVPKQVRAARKSGEMKL